MYSRWSAPYDQVSKNSYGRGVEVPDGDGDCLVLVWSRWSVHHVRELSCGEQTTSVGGGSSYPCQAGALSNSPPLTSAKALAEAIL